MIRRVRPDIPCWAAFATVRSMERTAGSDRWPERTILICAELVAKGWSCQAALAFRGSFLRNYWDETTPGTP